MADTTPTTTKAKDLLTDLTTLADLIDRRGRDWVQKWASLQAVRDRADRPADYTANFPNCPDPRD